MIATSVDPVVPGGVEKVAVVPAGSTVTAEAGTVVAPIDTDVRPGTKPVPVTVTGVPPVVGP